MLMERTYARPSGSTRRASPSVATVLCRAALVLGASCLAAWVLLGCADSAVPFPMPETPLDAGHFMPPVVDAGHPAADAGSPPPSDAGGGADGGGGLHWPRDHTILANEPQLECMQEQCEVFVTADLVQHDELLGTQARGTIMGVGAQSQTDANIVYVSFAMRDRDDKVQVAKLDGGWRARNMPIESDRLICDADACMIHTLHHEGDPLADRETVERGTARRFFSFAETFFTVSLPDSANGNRYDVAVLSEGWRRE